MNALSSAASSLLQSASSALGATPSHAASMRKQIRIQQLFVHPIKSCRGTSVREAYFDDGGLRYDRTWLIIDARTKKFQTARDLPRMVTIVPKMDLASNTLSIEIPLHEQGKGSVVISTPLDPSQQELDEMDLVEGISIWVHTVDGYAVSKEADEYLSLFFGKDVRLVRKGPTIRPSGPDDPRGSSSSMHYQDFYPFLIATSASLQHVRDTLLASVYSSMSDANGMHPVAASDLGSEESPPGGSNAKNKGNGEAHDNKVVSYNVPDSIRRDYWTPEQLETLEIRRFRPNVLVESFGEEGQEGHAPLVPWEEDSWTHVEICRDDANLGAYCWGANAVGKGVGIDCVARCARCLVPSIDPDSGYRDPHLPYLVLQKFRVVQPEYKSMGKPCFGVLASPCQTSGLLRVGDLVRVTSTMDPTKRTMKKPGH